MLVVAKESDLSVPVYDTAEPMLLELAEKLTTTLFVPVVGLMVYHVESAPPAAVATKVIGVPAYETDVTKEERT